MPLESAPLSSPVSPQQRLIVSWQEPTTRAMRPIGVLTCESDSYAFEYLRAAERIDGFQPLLGFPELDTRYVSDDLFPLFAQRAMDPRRPDFERYVTDLGLDEDASPWEQISRSGGTREGDTLQLFPVPRYKDGVWQCYFLAAGMRYLLSKEVEIDGEARGNYDAEQFESILATLAEGDQLDLFAETTNEWEPLALLVTTATKDPLGYVPGLLLKSISEPNSRGLLSTFVSKINPAAAGWHMRMIVHLTADLPADFDFFAGSDWARFTVK